MSNNKINNLRIYIENQLESIIHSSSNINEKSTIIQFKSLVQYIKNNIKILENNKKINVSLNNLNIFTIKSNNELKIGQIHNNKEKLELFFNYLLRKKDYIENFQQENQDLLEYLKNKKLEKNKYINVLQKDLLKISKNQSIKVNFDFKVTKFDIFLNKKVKIDSLFNQTRLFTN